MRRAAQLPVPSPRGRVGAAPLGVVREGGVTTFGVYSRHASRVELCLAWNGREERLDLTCGPGFVWSREVPDLVPGVRYGLRAHGPFRPEEGHFFTLAVASSIRTPEA